MRVSEARLMKISFFLGCKEKYNHNVMDVYTFHIVSNIFKPHVCKPWIITLL